jgi:hypothetical protein
MHASDSMSESQMGARDERNRELNAMQSRPVDAWESFAEATPTKSNQDSTLQPCERDLIGGREATASSEEGHLRWSDDDAKSRRLPLHEEPAQAAASRSQTAGDQDGLISEEAASWAGGEGGGGEGHWYQTGDAHDAEKFEVVEDIKRRPWLLPNIVWAVTRLHNEGYPVVRGIVSIIIDSIECVVLPHSVLFSSKIRAVAQYEFPIFTQLFVAEGIHFEAFIMRQSWLLPNIVWAVTRLHNEAAPRRDRHRLDHRRQHRVRCSATISTLVLFTSGIVPCITALARYEFMFPAFTQSFLA